MLQLRSASSSRKPGVALFLRWQGGWRLVDLFHAHNDCFIYTKIDIGGVATPSQEFTFDGGSGPLAFEPLNQAGSCFAVKGNVLDIANCDDNDANQKFTFGDAAAGGNGAGNDNSGDADTTTTSAEVAETTAAAQTSEAVETTAEVTETTAAETVAETAAATTSTSCTRRTRTVKVTAEATHATAEPATTAATSTAPSNDDFPVAGNPAVITDTTANGGQGIPNPTEAVPVSGAGGTLNPTAVAESHQRDDTATRAFESVEIRSPNGQCLFVDPTGGDFRENLIPITLVDCGGTPNEKWDVITAGKHNNADASAIIVSSLTQGCISFDGRRQAGDTVTIFSCGGRADGEGETNSGQLMPFLGELSFAFAPESEGNKTCILPDESLGRLSSGPCPTDGAQLFSIFP